MQVSHNLLKPFNDKRNIRYKKRYDYNYFKSVEAQKSTTVSQVENVKYRIVSSSQKGSIISTAVGKNSVVLSMKNPRKYAEESIYHGGKIHVYNQGNPPDVNRALYQLF